MKRKISIGMPTYLPARRPFVGCVKVAPWHGSTVADWLPQLYTYAELKDAATDEVLATTIPQREVHLTWEEATTLRHFMEHDIELPMAWGYRHWRDTYTATDPVPATAVWLGNAFKRAAT